MGYGLYVISSGTGVLAPVACELVAPQTWRQHRGARTTRFRRPQPGRSSVGLAASIAFRPNVRDDRDTPLDLGSEQNGNIKQERLLVKAKY